MIKLANIFFIALIAASVNGSVSNSFNVPLTKTLCDDSCKRTLQPMLDLISAQQNRLSACKQNYTNAEQVRIDGQLEDLRINIEKFSPTFEKIGSRFFYIEKRSRQNWFSAANICRQKGGYLASIQSAEEFALILPRLNEDVAFWLDINDWSNQGEYISTSSGQEAPFLKWQEFQPSSMENSQRCVSVIEGNMRVESCGSKNYFICQSDCEN
uniref:Accessory gland protein Acp29AB-like n=1 Tax=Drosophila rhopaloa TaxID=1041015 RepID=A0A6P4F2Y6_DRORH